MARKTSKSSKSSSASAMPVTPPRTVEAEPAQAEPVPGGPTTGYRDGETMVETKVFMDGVIPDGWYDTPADCELDYRDGMHTVA